MNGIFAWYKLFDFVQVFLVQQSRKTLSTVSQLTLLGTMAYPGTFESMIFRHSSARWDMLVSSLDRRFVTIDTQISRPEVPQVPVIDTTSTSLSATPEVARLVGSKNYWYERGFVLNMSHCFQALNKQTYYGVCSVILVDILETYTSSEKRPIKYGIAHARSLYTSTYT